MSLVVLVLAHSLFVKVGQKISQYLNARNEENRPTEEELEENHQQTSACPAEEELEENHQQTSACPAEENLEENHQQTSACLAEENLEENHQQTSACLAEENCRLIKQTPVCSDEEEPEEETIIIQQTPLSLPEEELDEENIVIQQSPLYLPEEELDEDIIIIQQSPLCWHEEKLKEDNNGSVEIAEINHCEYEVGRVLGKGAFGAVYEGRRVDDGLEVAIKYVEKKGIASETLWIPSHPEPLPVEIALQFLANQEPRVPEILQMLDWEERDNYYLMVLERMSPCMDLIDFVITNGNQLNENLARVIIQQAITAANECCRRGVFHRDIKLENLLINPKTLEVKLIDFGCGDILKETAYFDLTGTKTYFCPEAYTRGRYHAEPATVYSLGVTLFLLVCGRYPSEDDCHRLDNNTFVEEGLSEKCHSFIRACMLTNPERRIQLGRMLEDAWFELDDEILQTPDLSEDIQNPVDTECDSDVEIAEINHCEYEVGEVLGKGAFGAVYEGRRVHDGLEVAIKYVEKKGIACETLCIPSHPEPLPVEIALQFLANQEPRVPEILQMLDWEERNNYYLMVLERMSPCMDLIDFVNKNGNRLNENLARVIIQQATTAAYECCRRGVFHRDIKLENLLINPETLEVKLIDFGCGDILEDSAYTKLAGTKTYFCPEAYTRSEYYAEPATVYSLGVTLFILVCGRFPSEDDCHRLDNNTFVEEGLSEECLRLIGKCMRTKPERRIQLGRMLDHTWFEVQETVDVILQTLGHSEEVSGTSEEELKNNEKLAIEGSCSSSTRNLHERKEENVTPAAAERIHTYDLTHDF